MAPGVNPAYADPQPSASDVAKSKVEVRKRAAEVGRVQAELARANGALEALNTKVEVLVERYNGERVKLEHARASYRDARQRLTAAEKDVAEAHEGVRELAVESYQMGGVARIGSLFDADGPQDLVARVGVLQALGRKRDARLDHARSTRVVSSVLRQQARDAYVGQRAATERVAAAKKAAEEETARYEAQVKRITAKEKSLEAELAAARAHAGSLERARQQALERERKKRAAAERAAAKKAADEARQAGSSHAAVETVSHHKSHHKSRHKSRHKSHGAVAAAWALTQLGKWYEWAADGPDTYDCSGLTMMAWRHAGVGLPHWSVGQYASTHHVSTHSLRKGDLVFYATNTSKPSTIHHVGIYIGHGKMVEAPHTGAKVRISSIWRHDLIGASRPG